MQAIGPLADMRLPVFCVIALLVSWGGQAHAFQVKRSKEDVPLRWAEDVIPIYVDMRGGPPGIDPQVAVSAVKRAFATWEEVAPELVRFDVQILEGTAPPPSPRDHHNVVRWVTRDWDRHYQPGALAVALTTHDSKAGRITDADIVLNAEQYRWVAGDEAIRTCRGAYDLENVLAHEIGHLLGLAHERNDREATMYVSSAQCETKKRDLAPDDRLGLEYLYREIGHADLPGEAGCTLAVAPGGSAPGLAPGMVILGGAAFTRRLRKHVRAPRTRGAEGATGARTSAP